MINHSQPPRPVNGQNLGGTYSGTVVSNKDPLKRGRIKVRVPLVYGPSANGMVADADLPWCIPLGIPSGHSEESGGHSWLPQVGDRVMVRFLDGEPEKPAWSWSMQDTTGQSTLPLNTYTGGNSGSGVATAAQQQTQNAQAASAASSGKWASGGDTGVAPGATSNPNAYTLQVKSRTFNTGATTTTGLPLQQAGPNTVGIASVDPAVIPYGSQIMVQTTSGTQYYIAGHTDSTVTGSTTPAVNFYSNSPVGGATQTISVVPFSGTNFTGLSQTQKTSLLNPSNFGVNGNTNANPANTPGAIQTSAGGQSAAAPPAQDADPSRRSAMTRYGHIVEWSPTQLLTSTGRGYSMTLVESSSADKNDGYMSWKTPKNNYVEIHDDTDTITVNVNDLWQGIFKELHFTGQTYEHYARDYWYTEVQNKFEVYSKDKIKITGNGDMERTIIGDLDSETRGDEGRTVRGKFTLTTISGDIDMSAGQNWMANAVTKASLTAPIVVLQGGSHSITISAAGIVFA